MQYMLDYRMNKGTDLYVQKKLCDFDGLTIRPSECAFVIK